MLQKLAGAVADSVLFAPARKLWEANSKNWSMPLSKADKLLTGGYLILSDYRDGIFPPQFEDQAKAYAAEINYHKSLPGHSSEQVFHFHATKPFCGARGTRLHLSHYIRIQEALESRGVTPPQRILELGCGPGWTSEFLALAGYSAVGTTIAPFDVEIGKKKIESLRTKGLKANLEFHIAPMESVDTLSGARESFDAAFIYEALHHAFDWRKAIESASKCLKRGGWMLLANEPNVLHTAISYRVAKLAGTHEIGMSKSALCNHFRSLGFDRINVLSPRFDNLVTSIWIIARKGDCTDTS